jgi:hypothetical protein
VSIILSVARTTMWSLATFALVACNSGDDSSQRHGFQWCRIPSRLSGLDFSFSSTLNHNHRPDCLIKVESGGSVRNQDLTACRRTRFEFSETESLYDVFQPKACLVDDF